MRAFLLVAKLRVNTSGEVTRELVRRLVKFHLMGLPLTNSLVAGRVEKCLLVGFAHVRIKWRIHHQKLLAVHSEQLHKLPNSKKFH